MDMKYVLAAMVADVGVHINERAWFAPSSLFHDDNYENYYWKTLQNVNFL